MTVWREHPTLPMWQDDDGHWWVRHDPDPNWVHLGYAPAPRTTIETIRYHIGHGLAVGFPLWCVVAYALRHRHSFSERGAA